MSLLEPAVFLLCAGGIVYWFSVMCRRTMDNIRQSLPQDDD